MIPLTDTHCHLASHKFTAAELESLVANAREAGVTRLVTLGTGTDDCPRQIEIAKQFPGTVFACIGIHPCDVTETTDGWDQQLLSLIEQHPDQVVAIGETGLDYFHPAPEGWTDETYHQRQRDLLRRHFEIAAQTGRNIVIHTRDRSGKQSLEDALEIARDFAGRVRPLFHCFLGPLENAAPILELDGIVSFTGIASFKGKNAHDTRQAATHIPLERMMVETDAPYLAPEPHRGKRNEPAFVRHTADAIAHLRGLTTDELATATNQVADGFFRFS